MFGEIFMIYFDNAATTFPKPPSVIREMARCMREYGGNPGRSGHSLSLAAAEAIFDVRARISKFFGGTKPENVIFTRNTTDAIDLAVDGISRMGDHFLISNLEHNSVYRTVAGYCEKKGMKYEIFEALCDDETLLRGIEKRITPKTRAIITTHASNICPRVLPIGKIGALCRKKGILFVVDAAQSAGIYDISMARDAIDILCAPGHKGLYGPQGSGFALFADGFDFSHFSPARFGGNGKDSALLAMGHEPPESFETGTASTPAIVGLGAGLAYLENIGRETVENREALLFRAASDGIRAMAGVKLYLPEARRGSLLLLGFEKQVPTAVASSLSDAGVCVRAGLHCAPLAHTALGTGGDALRISFSAFNTVDEVARFLRILEKTVKE